MEMRRDYSVASHPDTRTLFLKAHILSYLYPFLYTTSKSRLVENLRLTSLGVIGQLVKVRDTEVISYVISTGLIIPFCLHTMETGTRFSQTVATFIVEQILLDDAGLQFICTTRESISKEVCILRIIAEHSSSRLLRHIIRCYSRLADNPSACIALYKWFLFMLIDGSFGNYLNEEATKELVQRLRHKILGINSLVALCARGGLDHMLANQTRIT